MVSPFFAGALKGLEKGFAQRELKERQSVKDALALRKIVAAEKAGKLDAKLKKAKLTEYNRKATQIKQENELFENWVKGQKYPKQMKDIKGQIVERVELENLPGFEGTDEMRKKGFMQDVKPLADKYNKIKFQETANRLAFKTNRKKFIAEKVLKDPSSIMPPWFKSFEKPISQYIFQSRIASGTPLNSLPTRLEIGNAKEKVRKDDELEKEFQSNLVSQRQIKSREFTSAENVKKIEARKKAAKLVDQNRKKAAELKFTNQTKLRVLQQRQQFRSDIKTKGLNRAILDNYSPFESKFSGELNQLTIYHKHTGLPVGNEQVEKWLTDFKAKNPNLGSEITTTQKNGLPKKEKIVNGQVDDEKFTRDLRIHVLQKVDNGDWNESQADQFYKSQMLKRFKVNEKLNKKLKTPGQYKPPTFKEMQEFEKKVLVKPSVFRTRMKKEALNPNIKYGKTIIDSFLPRVIGDYGTVWRTAKSLPFLKQLFQDENYNKVFGTKAWYKDYGIGEEPRGLFTLRQDLEGFNDNVVSFYMSRFGIGKVRAMAQVDDIRRRHAINSDSLWTNPRKELQRLISIYEDAQKSFYEASYTLSQPTRGVKTDKNQIERANKLKENAMRVLRDIGNPYRLQELYKLDPENVDNRKFLELLSKGIGNIAKSGVYRRLGPVKEIK